MLVASSTVICWMGPFVILGTSGLFCRCYSVFFVENPVSNNVDPDQMPQHLGLHFFYGFPGKNGLIRYSNS